MSKWHSNILLTVSVYAALQIVQLGLSKFKFYLIFDPFIPILGI